MAIQTPSTAGKVVAFDGSAWSAQYVDRVSESGGQLLTLGAVAANTILARSGTTIAGVGAPTSQGDGLTYSGSAWVSTQRAWGIGTDLEIGFQLYNTTAATSELNQYAPLYGSSGQLWAVAANRRVDLAFGLQQKTGYAGSFALWHRVAGYAWSRRFAVNMPLSGGGDVECGGVYASAIVSGKTLQATGDESNSADRTKFTNVVYTPGATAFDYANSNVPDGFADTFTGYIKVLVGTGIVAIPYLAAI